MEQWVLVVGYGCNQFYETQKEWLKYGIFSRMEADTSGAILELSDNHDYLLVIIFSENTDYLNSLEIIRSLAKAPILIIKPYYDGAEKISAIEAGADEYIPWTECVEESVASGRALIRRYQESDWGKNDQPFTILSCGDLLLCAEYRRAFVCGKEILFTRQEFDFLFLLLESTGRVYTHDQIREYIWGDENGMRSSGALWNLVSRLRAKISCVGGDDKILQAVRDVGYRIDKVKSI